MCGLVGKAFGSARDFDIEGFLNEATPLLAHRGPDEAIVYVEEDFSVGHTRLAINDLSDAGRQPLFGCQAQWVVVVNGEIYNHTQLRGDLAARGHVFTGLSDSEVIVHLLEENGPSGLARLTGMFAVVAWDRTNRRLILCRDRIGEKPLFYLRHSSGVFFSSELGPLTKCGVRLSQSQALVTTCLSFDSLPAPLTPYEEVRSLKPGTYLVVSDSGQEEVRFWSPSRSTYRRGRGLSEEFEKLLNRVVIEESTADADVVAALSGGVDSSLLTLMAAEAGTIRTSVCVTTQADTGPFSDRERARHVAGLAKLDHFEEFVGSVDLADIPRLVSQYGFPISSHTVFLYDRISEVLARHGKVAITGGGADEVFWGYRGYERSLLLSRLASVLGTRRAVFLAMQFTNPQLKTALKNLSPNSSEPFDFFTVREASLVQALKVYGCLDKRENPNEPGMPHRDVYAWIRDLSGPQYIDQLATEALFASGQHGHNVLPDMSGMRHSLEFRSPYLHHEVVEFAWRLPNRMKIGSSFRSTNNKLILKKLLAQRTGKGFAFSRKRGFGYGIPWNDFTLGVWFPGIERMIRNTESLSSHLSVEPIIESRNPTILWRAFTLAVHLRLTAEGSQVDELRGELESGESIVAIS
jgi:asparagine synthase (glutamine-hydrolysing)